MIELKVGDVFQVRNKRCSAGGVVTKVNPTTVVYDAEYFVTSTSPDGWLRGLKIKKGEMGGARVARDGKEITQ